MATLINTNDFINQYAIAGGTFTDGTLLEFINAIEVEMLYKLFGKTMADLFIADSSGGAPADPLYVALYDAIQLSNYSGGSYYNQRYFEDYSSGMVEMLKAFVYTVYNQRANVSATIDGNKNLTTSVSTIVSGFNHYYANIYNKGVANYKVIQQYICENIEDYPDYDGRFLDYTDGL